MKKFLCVLVGLALVGSAYAATDYVSRDQMERIFDGNKEVDALKVKALTVSEATTFPAASVAPAALSGNIAQARITNALAVASGVKLTNTCLSATGKTNTYIFSPVGGVYVLSSIATSP